MTPKQSLDTAQRAAQVTTWHAEGMTSAEIGQRLGVSPQRAHQVWTKALRELPAPGLADYRRSQLELIRTAVRELLEIARGENVSARSRIEAWSAIRGWTEREAKLLGTDQPTRKEVTVITEDAIDKEIARLTAKLEERQAEVDVSGWQAP